MNLYKVTFESRVSHHSFWSPLFYEAENEIDSLSKFMIDLKTQTNSKSVFSPRNIILTKICKLKEIRK